MQAEKYETFGHAMAIIHIQKVCVQIHFISH